MTRQILIVDDIRSNRQILKNILGDEYATIEASDGQEALAIMNRSYKELSAVLLDLGMPVMDGFAVLSRMRASDTLSQLPVIVTTGQTEAESEVKALKLGANDYISKPYNSTIIKQRIRNTINLRETAATVNALRCDPLTGLLSREIFFERVSELVSAHAPGTYIMAAFDIDSFKVVNDQYGTEMGDAVLRHIASVFSEGFAAQGGLCSRMMADNFAVLYPASFAGTEALERIRRKAAAVDGLVSPLSFSIGRYLVDDLSLSPSAMYDRATLAEDTVKGRFDSNIAIYDESMRKHLLDEQMIVTEMKGALAGGQFELWFQPQYNHSTGAMIGAEALVRWRHPQKGLIAPGLFIPIFEKNGFIYELDKFVWEEACRLLRKWTDEARAPLPVSVNVSRYDLFRPDLAEVLNGLVRRYKLNVDLLRLEITESAFAESTQQIVSIVKNLIADGFTVEIDDFGSGYSSLNTLKSVPAQVLKLDMRFLEDDSGSGRGGNILESIVRMSKWLGMSVIAEGVEEKRQADFLKSIGCSYVQGYLYARPMPAADYERHCQDVGKEERLLAIETVENLDNDAFWDPKSMETLIFNSYVGAACIFENDQGNIELLRANDKFADILGHGTLTTDDTLKLDWVKSLTPESLAQVRGVLQKSAATREEYTGEYVFQNIPGAPAKTYLRATMRVIASAGKRLLVYCMCENITAQRLAEQSERRVAKQLKAIMDNVNCGITAVVLHGEDVEYLLANDRYYELLGYTRAEYEREINGDAYGTVYPADRPRVAVSIARVYESGGTTRMEFRALKRDGSTIWLRCSVSMTNFDGVDSPVQLTTYVDVTAEKLAAQELLDNLPDGAALYEYDGKTIVPLHLNKRYWELVDRAPVEYDGLVVLDAVHPDDRALIVRALSSAIAQGSDVTCDIRLRHGNGSEYRPFHVVGRIVPKNDGKYAIYASYTPISDEAMSIQEMLPVAMQAVMNARSDLSFVKDRELRYISCSHGVYEAMGAKSEAEIIGKTDAELLDAGIAALYAADDTRVLENGESLLDAVFLLPSADGKERYANMSKYPLKDSKGNTIGIYAVGRDITETRAMKSQLALLTNNVPGGIAVYEGRPDALDRIKLSYFSDGFCRLFGFTREEYDKRAAADPFGLVFPEDLSAMTVQIRALIQHDTPIDCIYRAKAADGSRKWINLKAVKGEPHGGNLTVNAVLFDVTARQDALERLRMSEEENRLAMQHSGSAVCRFDIATRTMRVPESARKKYGTDALLEDVPYGSVLRGNISKDTEAAYTAFYESILRGAPSGAVTYQRMSAQGWRWIEAHASTIFSGAGEPASAVISFSDITEQLEKEAVYKRWQQSIQNKKPESYSLFRCAVSKKTSFTTMEGALLTIRFAPGPFEFDAHTAEYAAQCVLEEDRARFTAFLNVDALLVRYYHGERTLSLDYRELLPEADYRWLRLTVDLVESPHSKAVEAYLLFEDIDEAKRAELKTLERAETDPLTGMYNRAAFAEKVDALIHGAKPYTQHAMMMLDVDGFKMVNDAFGHSAGDQALIEIADALRSALRHNDLVGRLGGDEFAVFLADIPSDAVAAGKARQICALTRKAYSMEVEISGSIGIAVTPRDGTSFYALYKKADAALYYVKGSGKDNYAFYHEDMAEETLKLDRDERDALPLRRPKKRRMLIVDDSRIDHALLTNMFADDFIVEKAKDGNSALIRLRHYGSAISVVLLDLVMPGMDGFAVLDKMQQSAELRNIPVIVVSGDESRETSLRAIRAGAVDFVNKPVDPDILRIRVQSAISKAENERLRAKKSFLEYQSGTVARYRTVLERSGTVVIEHDWVTGEFLYDPSIGEHIAGVYDGRKLWHILLSDLVADTASVRKMQELVHALASDRRREYASMTVQLKTPAKARHSFRMNVYKVTNEYGLTGKLYITFNDLDALPPGDGQNA